MDEDQRFASMTVFKALPPGGLRLDEMGLYHGSLLAECGSMGPQESGPAPVRG